MSISLDEFVDLPGFFRVEKGSRATGPTTSVAVYMVGADPYTNDGEPTVRVTWGEGASVAGALDDWWHKNESKRPKENAAAHWRKRAAAARQNQSGRTKG
jgi:hypothetical protein